MRCHIFVLKDLFFTAARALRVSCMFCAHNNACYKSVSVSFCVVLITLFFTNVTSRILPAQINNTINAFFAVCYCCACFCFASEAVFSGGDFLHQRQQRLRGMHCAHGATQLAFITPQRVRHLPSMSLCAPFVYVFFARVALSLRAFGYNI